MAATSPHEQHEVVFRWPHTEPQSVILTGSFDDWSKSINLTRTDKGFETRIRLPYDQKTPYKFIVDGTWLVDSSNPTEYDPIGNLNNVYNPPPQPPVTKVTPPGTPVVIGAFETSKETTSPAKVPKAANGVNGSYFPKLNGDDDKSTKRSSSRLSLSDLASTFVARDGVANAYEYVKSGLGAVIGGVVGVDPINAGQIAIPTPNTAANTTFNSEVPTEPTPPVTAAGETQLAPNVPIAIVPVNSAENNTIVNSPAGENGDAKENEHTHSPVISPVKGASKGPLIPIDNIPVLDKDAQDKADPVLPEPEEEKKEEAPASAKEEETPAPEADKKEDTPAPAAPVSEEMLGKAVPTPLGPVVPPEATKEEEKETAPAPEPTPAVVEAPAAEPEATKEEEKVEAERPSTPPPATTVTAPSAPSSPSKPAPAESAPTTPLNAKKGGSFKRGSLSSAFGSIKGRKEARRSVSASAASNGKDSSSSSESSSDGGKEGGKKKKRESIFKKIKRVLTPHHHHHHHEHEHGHGEGEIKEKA